MEVAGTRSILIPDGESHLLIYVVQCLSRNKANRIHVMSSKKRSEMRFSKHLSSYTYVPEHEKDVKWVKSINTLVEKFQINVLLPIFEVGIRRIILNKELLCSQSILCALPDLQDFDIAADKWKLYRHLKQYGIPVPKTTLYRQRSLYAGQNFPLVAKPTFGFGGGMQIELIKDAEELSAYFQTRSLKTHNYILQEYIDGTDYSCSVLCRGGRILAYTIQRSEMSSPNGYGPQLVYSFVHDDTIYELVAKLMDSLNWSGIASIDLRYDKETKVYKVLEINTRVWRSIVGSLYAGVNFLEVWIRTRLCESDPEPLEYNDIRFYDLKGFIRAMRTTPFKMLHPQIIIKRTAVSEILEDPLPWIYKFVQRSKNILVRRLRFRN